MNIKTIQELNQELSKHRKLLHRAVGNQVLPHINYHHYEIVRIIKEINDSASIRTRYSIEGIFDKDVKALGDDFQKHLNEQFQRMEDNAILTGQFNNFTTNSDGSHMDTHLSKDDQG